MFKIETINVKTIKRTSKFIIRIFLNSLKAYFKAIVIDDSNIEIRVFTLLFLF